MIPLQNAEKMRLKGLCAETDAVDAIFGQQVDFLGIQSTRVCLDGEFTVRCRRQSLHDFLQKLGKPAIFFLNCRATTEKERFHAFGLAKRSQFGPQGLDVQIDLMVLSGSHCEIAIATMVSAKRDMDVGCTRPQPGWLFRL